MNELEQKFLMLCRTSQPRWYDLRFKPIIAILSNMENKGEISLQSFDVSIYKMLGISTLCFKYESKWYFIFVEQHPGANGTPIYEFFQIESYYKKPGLSFIMQTDIVATSDDDNWGPNKTTNNRFILPIINNEQFRNKFPL